MKLKPGVPLPSPEDLKYKILIKFRKKRPESIVLYLTINIWNENYKWLIIFNLELNETSLNSSSSKNELHPSIFGTNTNVRLTSVGLNSNEVFLNQKESDYQRSNSTSSINPNINVDENFKNYVKLGYVSKNGFCRNGINFFLAFKNITAKINNI